MNPLVKLRNTVLSWNWISESLKIDVLEQLDNIDQYFNDDLIQVGEAAEILDVSERHLWRIADDPEADIHRYNSDGTRKSTNARTKTYFRKSEVHEYQLEKIAS